MADLRDLLHRAAPSAPDFDEAAVVRGLARRTNQRRVALAVSACLVAAAVAIGIASAGGSKRHSIIVSPSTTPSSSPRTAPSTTTASSLPARTAVAPIQTSEMPTEAFVSVGASLLAIDTHDPTQRRTIAAFPHDSGITGVRLDRPHDRVFFTVTSGCDPGINGMYETTIEGSAPRKISGEGSEAEVSPDGTKIAYSQQTDGCGSRNLVVQDLASGRRQTFTGTRSIGVGGWSTDGQSLYLNTYDGSRTTVYRFRPFDPGAQLDGAERWDTGIASDVAGGRVAILDWCDDASPTSGCVVGVRTRRESGDGPDYSYGRLANVDTLSVDSSGQWPLLVRETPEQVVSFYAGGTWHDLARGGSADW